MIGYCLDLLLVRSLVVRGCVRHTGSFSVGMIESKMFDVGSCSNYCQRMLSGTPGSK